ncbi:GspE/PulE family protein [Thalassoglobus sp. JC818]|uniref:GspE/PulE family protein n=1 Tax=Thalassoglobus sp. JC818 TaxID=3232136 RepID=UPI00345A3704
MTNESSNSPSGAEEANAMIQEIAPEARQKALQEELKGLISLVGVEPLVDLLLERAFQLGATDIHLDPRPNGMNLRLRLDGVMHEILHLDPEYAPQLVSRIKLIAGMNIAEKRIAQDGHFSNMMMEQNRDVRVGSGPTIYGERIVMRLMSDGSRFTSLDQLGLSDKQISAIEQATARPHGMILSVGPVGCGKSTTTYSCLASLNEATRSLVTIEDPVERRIPGVNQIQVDNRAHFGFVEALRGVLRQDPDVIMVGEIRDQETAHIAVRAGLMGSKVLSTLHASDTGATLDMFREFQITRMFLADAISCIIAQRLIRRVCEKNRETYTPDETTCEMLGIDPAEADQHKLVRGIPADSNFHTGYFGRTGVFEVLAMNPSLRNYVVSGKPGRTVFEAAQEQGMETLEQSARAKVLAGITTPEEMMRVLM